MNPKRSREGIMPKFYDFTIPIHENMSGVPPVFSRPVVKLSHTYEKDKWLAEDITLNTHDGTHVDCPAHMFPGTKTVDQVPLKDLIGTGVILDIPSGEMGKVTAGDLEKAKPKIRKGDIVLIHTGWSLKTEPWRKEDDDYLTWKRPGLTIDAAQWLADKEVRMVGIDNMAISHPDTKEGEEGKSVHYILLGKGIIIVEGLINLQQAVGKRARIYVIPMPLKGGGGSIARVFAEIV
jgi:kynurenine formamidase